MKKIFISLAFVLFGLAPSLVHAQDNSSSIYDLSVSPPTAYLRIRPGNLALHTIVLKNNGKSAISVTPKLVDFVSDGVSGQPILSNNSSFPYLDLDKTSFENVTLNPGSTAQLTLNFSVPSTAENKEYPLTVLFEAKLPDQSPEETKVTGTIGSNIVVLVSDTDFLEQQFTVDSFASPPVIDSFQPLSFAPVIKNNSYAAGIASGSAQITNWQGTVVAQYQINPEVVLGYSTRQIQPVVTDQNQDVLEVKEKGLRFFSHRSAFLIGPYTFSIFVPSGDPSNEQLIEHKIVVWAVPISILIAVIVAAALITLYYVYRSKSRTFL